MRKLNVLQFICPAGFYGAEMWVLALAKSLDPERVMSIVDLLRDSFEVVIPSSRVTAVRADPDDNRILEAAMAARADCVVSGDKHLLEMGEWKGIQVVSPAQFIETVAAQQTTGGDG